MATLSFEGETHGELVTKVRRWLASIDGEASGHLTPVQAIEQGAELTKEALRIIATSAPGPIAESEVVQGAHRPRLQGHRHHQAGPRSTGSTRSRR